MKKFIAWILIIISLSALLLRFSDKAAEFFFGIKQTGGISILSDLPEATVFLDNREVGKTPFEDKNLDIKAYDIRIEKDSAFWQGRVKLSSGTITVVNRDIATDSASSAGETLTLDKGKGLTIISSPAEADIEIDGKSYGKTPKTIEDIKAGEHNISVTHTNYLTRSIKANLPEGLNLTVSVDLALSEADLTAIPTSVITQTPEVVVKQTPTGFLRVRDRASINGKEIGQVKPGDSLILLEETGSWDRIRLATGIEGYVSSSYVEKKP